ncbi:MAG: LptF/LptG family permease [Bacteroidales bacterium]|nr:LptF/LptG family permease [Bacteroidales bacterium]MDD4068435.1 LptF/LptG family permease [Bacteroidales bacterium]MDD4739667.1 LptF/LptG family permease [Bacteroidales bacterium]
MKKLDILIIKSFLGPLLLTFSISEFVLLLQFIWKILEKMIGKGLDTLVILQLFWYILVTLVPMALPLAILLASIMTLGNFGERYELVAMKSAGISLWRILRPMIAVVSLLSVFAFFFSNNFMPIAEKKMRTLMYEINTKKPTVNIRPNEFYADIEQYIIRIGAKDKDGKNLSDVVIYDHSKSLGNISITAAKKGQMYTEDNGNTLVFNLIDGYTYDESVDENSFDTRPLIRLNFKEQLIRFDVSDFAFKETEEDRYSNHYKMLNILQLNKNINELRKENSDFNLSIIRGIKNQITTPIIRDSNILKIDSLYNFSFHKDYSSLTKEDRQKVIEQASQRAAYLKSDLKMLDSKRNGDSELIIRHRNELHRKFTLSAACLILFFIGAPLGAIIRKGGLGMPVVVSVLSFILYYVVGMIGEKASVEGAVSSFLGMWSSTLVFLPIGLFLTIKATSDSSLLNSESWIKGLNKIKNLLTGHKFENK